MKGIKYVMLTLLIVISESVLAYDFKVNGILYNITSSTTVEVTKDLYSEYAGNITIPSTVNYQSKRYNVTAIGGSAFSFSTGLLSVTIPNSVTDIGEYNQEIEGVTNVEVIPVIA